MMGLIPTFAVFPVESIFAFNEIETGKAHSGTPIWGETGFPELSGAWNIKASKGTEKYSAEPENLKRALQLGARLRGGEWWKTLGVAWGSSLMSINCLVKVCAAGTGKDRALHAD